VTVAEAERVITALGLASHPAPGRRFSDRFGLPEPLGSRGCRATADAASDER
jgi:hypothetical protein